MFIQSGVLLYLILFLHTFHLNIKTNSKEFYEDGCKKSGLLLWMNSEDCINIKEKPGKVIEFSTKAKVKSSKTIAGRFSLVKQYFSDYFLDEQNFQTCMSLIVDLCFGFGLPLQLENRCTK